MKKIFLFIVLFTNAYTKMQGQSIIYTYNAQGSCISRSKAKSTPKTKSIKKLSTETTSIRVVVSPSTTFCDEITISAIGASNNLTYIMANISGQVVLNGSLANKGVTLITHDLPKGVYILKVSGNNYEHSYKMQKK